jgi:hypothetical protein
MRRMLSLRARVPIQFRKSSYKANDYTIEAIAASAERTLQ